MKEEPKEEQEDDLSAHGQRVPGRRLPPPGQANWEVLVENDMAENSQLDCVFLIGYHHISIAVNTAIYN